MAANNQQYIAAIDIGTTKVVAIAGIRDSNGKIRICGYSKVKSKGVVHGNVQNVSEVTASIKEAVRLLNEKLKGDFKNFFVGVAGVYMKGESQKSSLVINVNNDISITQTHVDQLTDQVYKLKLTEGDEIVHVIPQSYSVDGHAIVSNPVGMSGKKLEGSFFIVTGKSNYFKNIRTAIEQAGFKVIKFILQPFAAADAVLTSDEKEAGVVMVDIGGGTSDVVVYKDKIIKNFGIVPLGGINITNDLKKGCYIVERVAELLKVQHGKAVNSKSNDSKVVDVNIFNDNKSIPLSDVANIINARLDDIIAGIMGVMEKSGISDFPAGMIITGGTAKLDSIIQWFKFRFSFSCRNGFPKVVSDLPEVINDQSLSAPVGLIIKGFEMVDEYSKRNAIMKEKMEAEKPDNNKPEERKDSSKTSEKNEEHKKPKPTKKIGFFKKLFDSIVGDGPQDEKL